MCTPAPPHSLLRSPLQVSKQLVAAELRDFGQEELARETQVMVSGQVAGQAQRETQKFAMDLAAASDPAVAQTTPANVVRKRRFDAGATPPNTASEAAMAAAASPAPPASGEDSSSAGSSSKKARS